ncbi:uncharacterized protein LOC111306837 [Durio zibethinus]|uniref:Uncharacterized protein LOC111306837 n=1 Tax=Durio zibethinus TaxID=66656 RepID=A0A6P6A6U7_DURZI|nr:uncharacterized protein LOC111306837 [Durio zibethinus]
MPSVVNLIPISMSYFLCKTILHGRQDVTAPQSHKLLGVAASLTLRYTSSSSNELSFTVSYLKNKCGLSLESALTASRYVHFETPEKPASVIALFKNHGFSELQITRLIEKRPVVLTSAVKKTLLPKLEFFRSKGVSSPDLAQILCHNPNILVSSLEKQIIPSFNFLSNVLKSDEKVIRAVKRSPRLMGYNINAILLPNINILLDNGVPESNIVTPLYALSTTLIKNPIRFKDMVEEAKEMGFNPSRRMFMVALFAMSSISKPTWKRKFEVFKKFGWSEEEVFKAFRRCPTFIEVSEDKFMVTMDFLVNKMGIQSSLIAKRPRILLMSLEKKIVPRGLFALDLLSKGVIKRINLQALLETSDDLFIEKFVSCYKEEASELLKLYQEKLNLSKNWKMALEMESQTLHPSSHEDSNEHVASSITVPRLLQEGGLKFGKSLLCLTQRRYEQLHGDSKERAKCIHCGKVLIGEPRSGTSSLKCHLKKCPKRQVHECEVGPPSNIESDVYREMIAENVIEHGYPFEWVEHRKLGLLLLFK